MYTCLCVVYMVAICSLDILLPVPVAANIYLHLQPIYSAMRYVEQTALQLNTGSF